MNNLDDSAAGVEPEVLEWCTSQGHFDSIKKKVLDQLRQYEPLKEQVLALLDSSKALEQGTANGIPTTPAQKKKLLADLRAEKEKELMELTSRAAWTLMSQPGGDITRIMESTLHQALCAVYDQKHAQAAQAAQDAREPQASLQRL